MMRVTNSMMVKKTKTNINANRAKVDYANNQMALQKKIVKPSDNPIIAIRALRLRSTLSTITQYYEHNIPDTEAWMNCTGTALDNMKSMLKDAYDQSVYGATDSLNTENRQAILTSLQSLQDQIYKEGNADYAGRTIFTGYKTNRPLTFTNAEDASNAHYNITERFTYKDVDQKKYYAGTFDVSDVPAPGSTASAQLFEEKTLNRLRMSYGGITPGDDSSTKDIDESNTLNISYTDAGGNAVSVALSSSGEIHFGDDCTVYLSSTGSPPSTSVAVTGSYFVYQKPGTNQYEIYKNEDMTPGITPPTPNTSASPAPVPVGTVQADTAAGSLQAVIPDPKTAGSTQTISYRVTNTADLKTAGYAIGENEIVFDAESGELIFKDSIANLFETGRASFQFTYDKKDNFKTGELRPENYFDCTKYMADREPIVYDNYDAEGNWKTQAIYYNIAGGQQMQINTEARDVFDSNIRRDIDDLIGIVQAAISAQDTVDSIEAKIKSGDYQEDDPYLQKLNDWLDAAKTQRDYANQNMHDTYSAYITKFQGYMDKVSLANTDLGGRGERVALTKNRMNVQQTTFDELKSLNEDMDLSDLVINYTAATVAYQAALQASAKINQMTLLNFI